MKSHNFQDIEAPLGFVSTSKLPRSVSKANIHFNKKPAKTKEKAWKRNDFKRELLP